MDLLMCALRAHINRTLILQGLAQKICPHFSRVDKDLSIIDIIFWPTFNKAFITVCPMIAVVFYLGNWDKLYEEYFFGLTK